MATQVDREVKQSVYTEQPPTSDSFSKRGSLITAAALIGGLSLATIGFVESDRGAEQAVNNLQDKILVAHMTLPREEVAEAIRRFKKESFDEMKFREIFFPGMLFAGAFTTGFGVLRVTKMI